MESAIERSHSTLFLEIHLILYSSHNQSARNLRNCLACMLSINRASSMHASDLLPHWVRLVIR
jgi:hypothetical protein